MNVLASRIYARTKLLVLLLSLLSVCFTTKANMVGLSLIIETEWEWNTFMDLGMLITAMASQCTTAVMFTLQDLARQPGVRRLMLTRETGRHLSQS